MKMLLCSAFLSLALPAAAMAGFESYFGNYTVVSLPNDVSSPECPLVDASVSRKIVNGYPSIVLETWGQSADCSATYTAGWSVQGMPGITCTESESQIRCTNGADTYDLTASLAADGVLTVHGVQTGAYPGVQDWILLRK